MFTSPCVRRPTDYLSLKSFSLFYLLLFFMFAGCGKGRDVGALTGVVKADGKPRGFVQPEIMNIQCSRAGGPLPITYSASVQPDGTFKADMNDGTGRGIPSGTYALSIDVDGLLMRMPGENRPQTQDPDDKYPQPSSELKKKLRPAKAEVVVAAGKPVHVIIDLDKGTITEHAAP